VAEGVVVKRDVVHGASVVEDEVAVSVAAIVGFDEILHPKYGYPIEAGGYTSLKQIHCKKWYVYEFFNFALTTFISYSCQKKLYACKHLFIICSLVLTVTRWAAPGSSRVNSLLTTFIGSNFS
jgi:hypothetical protein